MCTKNRHDRHGKLTEKKSSRDDIFKKKLTLNTGNLRFLKKNQIWNLNIRYMSRIVWVYVERIILEHPNQC